ncbi:MAG: DUF222 domain-containing protein [Actinomycetota bacterium]
MGGRTDAGIVGKADLTQVPAERLESEIAELAAHIHAATCRWLLLVAEYDRREAWADYGFKSCAHWLTYRCGLAPSSARAHVAVARRLLELPKVTEAFSVGRLSFSQARAITRIATPATEQYLLDIARDGTAEHLEKVVRGFRKSEAIRELERANGRHEGRRLNWFYDDDGSLVINARLPPEDGAVVIKALHAAVDNLARNASAEAPDGRRVPDPQPITMSPPNYRLRPLGPTRS